MKVVSVVCLQACSPEVLLGASECMRPGTAAFSRLIDDVPGLEMLCTGNSAVRRDGIDRARRPGHEQAGLMRGARNGVCKRSKGWCLQSCMVWLRHHRTEPVQTSKPMPWSENCQMCMPVLIHVIDDRRLSASAPTLLVPTLKAPYPDQSVFRALTGSSVTVHVISGSTGNAMLVHRPALRRCGFYRSARWAALFEHAGAQAVLLLLTLYSSGW